MRQPLLLALRATLLTLLVGGVAYPLLVTVAASLLFPAQAEGSWLRDVKGEVVGSEWIGQSASAPGWFQPRPSAAGSGWDATSSGGSNLGPTSRKLHERAAAEVARLSRENPDAPGPVPLELVAASASGLDPHLSPLAARWQVPRIAKARGADPARVAALLEDAIEGRDLGFLGEPRVNVLRLNLALQRTFGSL